MRSAKIGSLLSIIVVFTAGACSAYQPAPLDANHPAHPSGPLASASPRSKTLDYGPDDAAAARGRPVVLAQSEKQTSGAQELVSAEGKVVAVVPGANQLVVEHGEIKGFMDAMTMGYRVDPISLLQGLQFGDKIRFAIDVPKKAIVKIEKMK